MYAGTSTSVIASFSAGEEHVEQVIKLAMIGLFQPIQLVAEQLINH